MPILTTFEIDEYVFEAMRSGASGFLLKTAPPAELLRAIRLVAVGDALLSPSITRRLIEEFARVSRRPTEPPTELQTLTEREREVLSLMAAGLSNAEVAQALFLGEATERPTSRESSTSSTSAIGYKRSSTPTRMGWCSQASGRGAKSSGPTKAPPRHLYGVPAFKLRAR